MLAAGKRARASEDARARGVRALEGRQLARDLSCRLQRERSAVERNGCKEEDPTHPRKQKDGLESSSGRVQAAEELPLDSVAGGDMTTSLS